MHPSRPLALLALLCLLLAACGGADDTTADSTEAAASDAASTEGADAADSEDQAGSQGVEVTEDLHGVTVTGELGSAPQIELPDGEPPTELVVVDLVEGDGAEAQAGADVTTHYSGVSWLNGGQQFDSSWERGEPLTFPLAGVIQGWQEGIPGMRIGGRRMLIIPPEMAYGSQPPSGAPIAPDDTLVFVIDLEGVG